jgi:hypothetical protein
VQDRIEGIKVEIDQAVVVTNRTSVPLPRC